MHCCPTVVWPIELVDREEQPKIEGKKPFMRTFLCSLRHRGSGAFAALKRAASTCLRARPDTFYSEQTGGVAYNPQHALYSPMWTFGEDDIEAKAFLLKSLTLSPCAGRNAARLLMSSATRFPTCG